MCVCVCVLNVVIRSSVDDVHCRLHRPYDKKASADPSNNDNIRPVVKVGGYASPAGPIRVVAPTS